MAVVVVVTVVVVKSFIYPRFTCLKSTQEPSPVLIKLVDPLPPGPVLSQSLLLPHGPGVDSLTQVNVNIRRAI